MEVYSFLLRDLLFTMPSFVAVWLFGSVLVPRGWSWGCRPETSPTTWAERCIKR